MQKDRQDIAQISELLESLSRKDFCFICGTIKSGTTWVQLLLDAHPEIRCRGEGHLVNVLSKELGQSVNKYNEVIYTKNTKIFKEIEGFPVYSQKNYRLLFLFAVFLLFSEYGKIGNVRVIGEKTPDNVRYLDSLKDLFPRAKFIHVVRDGRDIAVSGWYHNLRITPNWAGEKFENIDTFAEVVAHDWSRSIDAAKRFSEKNPNAILEVRYEDLLSDPAAQVERIFLFLGVDASQTVIKTCCRAASFESLSGGRQAGVEDRSSHFRKATKEQWREELSEQTLSKFQSIAGAQLRMHGYEP